MKVDNKKEIFEKEGLLFNHIRSMYFSSKGYEHYWQNRRKDIIISHLKALKNECHSLLDVGCAEGLFVIEAGSLGYFSVGCDISRSKISKVRKAKVMESDAQYLPIKDDSFDIVLLNRILEYVPNDRKAILEATRVASKYVIITVPNKDPSFMFKIYRILYRRKREETIHAYEWGLKSRSYDIKELENMLEDYGHVIKRFTIAPFGNLIGFNFIEKIPNIFHKFLDDRLEGKPIFNKCGHDIFCLIDLKNNEGKY